MRRLCGMHPARINEMSRILERNGACSYTYVMDIHVVSTLTSEDEDRVADALMAALADLLDGLPIAYALRIETSGARVVHRTNLDVVQQTTLDVIDPLTIPASGPHIVQ